MTIAGGVTIKDQQATISGNDVSHTVSYIVEIAAPAADGALQAITKLGINKGDVLDGHNDMTATSIDAVPLDDSNSRTLYKVTIKYSNAKGTTSQPGDDGPVIKERTPWEEPARFTFSTSEYSVALEKDKSDENKPVLNSVGDPFDPPIEVSASRTRISVSFSRQTSKLYFLDLVDTVNKLTITLLDRIFTPETLRLISYGETQDEYKNADGNYITYFNVTMELEHNANTWDMLVRDQGYRARPAPNEPPRIVMDGNAPKTVPTLLKDDGTIQSDLSNVNYKIFKPYEPNEWDGLIPTP